MSAEGNPMVAVWKRRAGGDSFGNTWDHDGAVVDVELDQARQLLLVKDGGFREAVHEGEHPAVPLAVHGPHWLPARTADESSDVDDEAGDDEAADGKASSTSKPPARRRTAPPAKS